MLTMKILQNRLKFSLLLMLFAVAFTTVASAQTKQEKEAAKAAEVKKLVDDQRFVFIAQTVLPQSGRVRQVTPDFDFTVTKDTITSWLPYFGRAFNATLGMEGGIKFESKDFEYTKTENKKGGWDILIKPKDAKDIQTVRLNITESGYAYLQVQSVNRQPISYNGYITEKKSRKKK
jgi:hypothetical protein